LIKHILNNIQEKKGIDQKSLSPDTLKLLLSYEWQGNIRELETALEHAAILAEDTEITPEHLPDYLKPSPPGISFHIPPDSISLKKVIKELTEGAEKELILRALALTNNNRTKAARLLGISHRSLLYKLKDYQLR
jgi:DNA-binding NtrC family response regulator